MFRSYLRASALLFLLLYLLVRLNNFAPNLMAERLQHCFSPDVAISQIQPDLKLLFFNGATAQDAEYPPVAETLAFPLPLTQPPAAAGARSLLLRTAPREIFIPPERLTPAPC